MSTADYQQTSVVELDSSMLNYANTPGKSGSHDIQWSNVNFSVGDKKILTDCWGSVSFMHLTFILNQTHLSITMPVGASRSSVCHPRPQWSWKVFSA
jgi:hypothetical protein